MQIGSPDMPIVFDVAGGGLGDECCSEPPLRYAKKYLYPTEEVKVFTKYPEVFRHIGWPCGSSAKELGLSDMPHKYFRIFSSPYQNVAGAHRVHPFASIAQPLFVSTVDYHSLMLLRRILPDGDRRIHLSVDPQTEASIVARIPKNSILVHIGHTDHSRSLPADYIEELTTRLIQEDFSPVLFGNPSIEVYPDINGSLRLRDLSVAETLALIKNVQILITNDSAPVHIASAWDNFIIVMPTIRHPDRLVHPRHGHRYFRAKALYEKLMVDDRVYPPHELIQEWEWTPVIQNKRDYLPRVSAVIDQAIAFRGQI